jgi:hypothetical protein
MPETPSAALKIALAYHRAWTSKDFELAMTYIADDIVCRAPAGPLIGASEFRAFMEPFSRLLTRSTLIASFGDDATAMVMYDAETVPVAHAPGAECVTVVDGRIVEMTIIFDRAPFDAARAAAAPAGAIE